VKARDLSIQRRQNAYNSQVCLGMGEGSTRDFPRSRPMSLRISLCYAAASRTFGDDLQHPTEMGPR
jgi:hypothetical protein